MTLRGLLAALLLFLVASPATAAVKDYDGPDGGWLVISVTTGLFNPGLTDVVLKFHHVGLNGGDFVEESRPLSLLFNDKADVFTREFDAKTQEIVARRSSLTLMPNRTKTDVLVVRVPSGPYELYDIRVTGSLGNWHYSAHLDDHPISFAINPGLTTYLGCFTPAPVGGKGIFGLPKFYRWEFLMIDQSDRDLPIARARNSALGPLDRGAPAAPVWAPTPVQSQPSQGSTSQPNQEITRF